MISTLEKEITFRFLKARKKDGFLNVISIFSFIGISLGVAVLIIVMSVMNGFRTELINKIVGFNSHITVKTYGNPIDEKKINKKNLKLISENIILSNSGEAIILKNDSSKGILLRGYKRNDFPSLEIVKKTWNDQSNNNEFEFKKDKVTNSQGIYANTNIYLGSWSIGLSYKNYFFEQWVLSRTRSIYTYWISFGWLNTMNNAWTQTNTHISSSSMYSMSIRANTSNNL